MRIDVMWIGTLIGVLSLAAGSILANAESNVVHWRTIIFTVLTFSQMGNALASRSEYPLLFRSNVKRNHYLWAAIVVTCLLQVAVIYVPQANAVLGTQALPISELLICATSGILFFVVNEIQKFLRIRNS